MGISNNRADKLSYEAATSIKPVSDSRAQPAKVVRVVRDLLSFLPRPLVRKFGFLMACTVGVSCFEAFVLSIVAVFATSVTNPEQALQSRPAQWAAEVVPAIGTMETQTLFTILGVSIVLLVLAKNATHGLVQYAYMRAIAKIAGYLGEKTLGGIMRMPYRWLMQENSADLMTTVQFAGSCSAFLNNIFTAVIESVLMVLMLSILVATNPMLMVLAALVLGLPAFVLVRWGRRRLDRIANRICGHRMSSMRNAMVALQGLKDIKISGREKDFCGRYAVDAYAFPLLHAKQEILASLPGWTLEVFGFTLLVGTTFFMMFVLDSSAVKITGTLSLLAVFAWRGLPAAVRVVTIISKFRNEMPYVHEIIAHMRRIEAMAQPEGQEAKDIQLSLHEQFRLDSVCFQYNDDQEHILEDVGFEVRKGECVGIIGESGAGKSTIMDIMTGLLKPSEGRLLLDGRTVGDDELPAWMRMVGYIPQAPYIYDATLAENVAFGQAEDQIDHERIRKACSLAAVDSFLDSLTERYLTPLGERGIRLSGGQQQRICIARALYDEPDILFFDEATSSLDSKSERQIQETITNLKGTVTMVIVAHRLSTVRDCDRIVWIDAGRVRMIGPPSEVLPTYRSVLDPETDGE